MDFAFIVPACPPERSRLLLKQIDLETKQCKLKSNADPLYARAQDRDAHGLAPQKLVDIYGMAKSRLEMSR